MLKNEIINAVQSITFAEPDSREANLADYASFTNVLEWEDRKITVWDAAIRQALKEYNSVYIPPKEDGYYISRPVRLGSGKSLRLDRETWIRAIPGMRTAMVRNEFPMPGNQLPEPDHVPDAGITISGGIWDYGIEARTENGLEYDEEASVTGFHGLFGFSNVDHLKISDLEIRKSPAFAIQISNAKNVEVSGITFRSCFADGLHINGPFHCGYVHDLINEGTGDDFIALNAWDWVHSHVTAGGIDTLVIENCFCRNGYSAVRLLPGIKRYLDGSSRDCPLHDILFRNIHGVRNFKLYEQSFGALDYVSEVGTMKDIYFDGIYGLSKLNRIPFDPPYYGQGDQTSCFDVLADVTHLVLENLHGDFDFTDKDLVIAAVGPISLTPSDPVRDLFPVDMCATVHSMKIGPVFGKDEIRCDHPAKFVKEFTLSVNPSFRPGKDYFRGGTGSGRIENIDEE